MASENSPIKPEELVNGIRAFCKAHTNPVIIKKYARFFKEGFDAYGLESGMYDACLTSLTKKHELNLKSVLGAAPALIGSGKYEETFFVITMLKRFYGEFSPKTFKEMEKWFKVGIVNWAHADVMAGDIVAVFLKNGIVPISALESWRLASNKYQRRISAVTLIKLLPDTKNIKPLLAFVEPMMTDPDREVHQGVGWFLREAWKLKKSDTEKFLLKWKNTAPRLIFQYATEKMTPEEKKRFKKDK